MAGEGRAGKGVALMVGAQFAFCGMCALVRCASNIDAYKTTLFRFVIGLGLLGTAALFGKIKLTFVHGRLLFLRGLFGGVAVFILFLSISRLGIGKGTVINYTFPIFAAILGALFLKERIGIAKAVAIAGAFVGIYLLAVDDSSGWGRLAAFGTHEAVALLGAVCSGTAVVLVKRLHDTDSTYAIFFAQCLIGLWLMIVPANLVPCAIGYSGGILLLGIGVSAAGAQLLMTEAYRHVSVTTGSLLMMLLPVLNLVVGVTIFQESVSPRSVLGSIIVIACCIAVLIPGDRPRP